MPLAQWFRPPRRVLAVFVAVIGAFAGTLAWLGWQFLQNNRSVEDRRVQEKLSTAADEVAAAFKQRLDRLTTGNRAGQPPRGIVRVTFHGDSILAEPSNALAYYPALPTLRDDAAEGTFATAETLEFHDQKPDKAASLYRSLAESPRANIRAGALVRLGRVLRNSGRREEALGTFDRLAACGDSRVDQLPAELVARESRCRVFEALGRRTELQREASIIQVGLQANRWMLLRPTREFYTAEAVHWGARFASDDYQRDAGALAAAAEWLFNHLGDDSPIILKSPDGPVLLYWKSGEHEVRSTMAGPSYLAAALRSRDLSVRCGLMDRDGHVLVGAQKSKGPRELRPSYATGLPWNLFAILADPDAEMANYTTSRRILFFFFGVVALVLAAGSYYILRSIAHEQAVARLQSGFVSAVSHELRTPLSSIVQISEMLAGDRVPRAETGPAFAHLVRESRRLQKLVESLLDFGRMESQAARYRMEPVEAESLVSGVTAEFAHTPSAGHHRIEVKCSDTLPAIRADREALSLALWNLLDNAVKYSPGSPEIEVRLEVAGDRVMISVQDHGMGIPHNEQKDVFKKFFRGSVSRSANVKGTGIGLAMVRHIVEAHRGEVTLTSEPGKGSTFRLLLPVEAAC